MSMILEFVLEDVPFQEISIPLYGISVLSVQTHRKKIVLSVIGEQYEDDHGFTAYPMKVWMISANEAFDRKGKRFIGSISNGAIWSLFEEI